MKKLIAMLLAVIMTVGMFAGFVKSIPLDIEEAAAIDGCGPVKTYFSVVLPMLMPTTVYRTIPIHIQYLKGSYGTVDLGATMAIILMAIIPVIILYLFCQKYIIKGVAAGAVKG